MAISDQIGRLTTLRNNIRSKLINLGILHAASTSATLSECYNVLSSVTGLGASSYTPTTTSQVIASGQYLSGAQTINAIPSTYIIPSGTITLSSSGTFDVGSYASADVTVTGGPSGMYIELSDSLYYLRNMPNSIPNHTYHNSIRDLMTSELHNANIIGSFAFSGAGKIIMSSNIVNWTKVSKAAFSNVTGIYLLSSNSMSVIRAPELLEIDQGGFQECGMLYDEDSFPKVTEVGHEAFAQFGRYKKGANNSYIYQEVSHNHFPNIVTYNSERTLYLPSCVSIYTGAFQEAYYTASSTHKTRAILPNVEYLGDAVFGHNVLLSYIEASKVANVGSYTFAGCSNLVSVSFPLLTVISATGLFAPFGTQDGDFSSNYCCSALTTVDFSSLTYIYGSYNFNYCIGLSVISFPLLSIISGYNNFYNCSNLQTLNFSNLSIIYGGSNFYNCIGLTQLNLPSLETISGGYNFCNCTGLSSINLPKLATIKVLGYTFSNCSAVSYMNFPSLTTISGPNNFRSCTNLQTISVPLLATISGGSTFYNCNNLPNINLPNWVYTSSTPSMFYDCHSLSLFSAAKLSIMSGSAMFNRCYHLISVILLSTSVCTLGSTVTNMFGSTPVSTYSTSAGRYASIFVPRSLVASYKTATNWTTISSKIVAYEDYFDSNGNPL